MTGCIPVVFNSDIRYPFSNLFSYREFTVVIEAGVLLDSVSYTHVVYDILNQIPHSDVIRLQRNVNTVAKFMQYGAYSFGDDAFTTALRVLQTL